MADRAEEETKATEAWAFFALAAAVHTGKPEESLLDVMLAKRGVRQHVDAGPALLPSHVDVPTHDEDGVVSEFEARRRNRARTMSRQQRRVMRTRSKRELEEKARRFVKPEDEKNRGVWSREVFRQIRAGVQDPSGRAAECLLYMLGTHEAAALAEHLDARVPMDRRAIAAFYAMASAPSNSNHDKLKLGLPQGLFAAVLADPNNPNMERDRRFRPTRRTLSKDLDRLERIAGLRRWQVPSEIAEAVEMKTGAKHPTNRYWVPGQRDRISMWLVAVALGDIVPEQVTPDDVPDCEEDREPLEAQRAVTAAELSGAPLGGGSS